MGLNQAGSGSGLWPVFSGQVTALAAVACLAAFTGDLRLPEARGGWLAATAGLTGGPGAIFYFLATPHGLPAGGARPGFLSPPVTILLGLLPVRERLASLNPARLWLAAASRAPLAGAR